MWYYMFLCKVAGAVENYDHQNESCEQVAVAQGFELRRFECCNSQQANKNLILLSIDNTIAKVISYALSRPKLNCCGFMTFESTFKVLKPDNFPFHLLQIAGFDKLSKVEKI